MQIRTRIKTAKPESEFDKTLEQELLNYSFNLAQVLNGGLKFSDNFNGEILTLADTGPADSEQTVPHSLKRLPTGFLVLRRSNAGVVYDSGTAWTTTTIFVKCSTGNATVTLFVF